MKDVDLKQQTKESIQRFVYGITFFKEVIDSEPEQFDKLMESSRIVEAEPNEFIIHKVISSLLNIVSWFYHSEAPINSLEIFLRIGLLK